MNKNQTPIPEMCDEYHNNALSAQIISDLSAAGFRFELNTGRFFHWRESPGIELIDGKWFPCDMFSNGEMQYSDDGYESPVEAAKQAVEFFK